MKRLLLGCVILFFGVLVFSTPVLASGKTVVIDPGHGGKFSGTSGYSGSKTGYYEKQANLEVALKLRKELKALGVTVYMTRDTDRHFASTSKEDLAARMKVANHYARGNEDNTVFISVHHNSLPSKPTMRGFETYYFDINKGIDPDYPPAPLQKKYSPESRRLAKLVHSSVLRNAPVVEGRGLIANDLFVTRNAHMASALVELGYMSNPFEEGLIKTSNFQQKAAAGLAKAINNYFKVYEVYSLNGKRLKVYLNQENALSFAKARAHAYVFDKYNQKVIYHSENLYQVEHKTLGILYESYDMNRALKYAAKYRNTAVVKEKSGEVMWSNYLPKTYKVEHATLGVLYESFQQERALAYAKKYRNTAVINQTTGDVLWSNYLEETYQVEHSTLGVLFESFNLEDAKKYAKLYRNTAVVHRETGEVFWSNYLSGTYEVEHSTLGVLYESYSLDDAIEYAEKYRNTQVVKESTGEVMWTF
ncbi:N-acetylmuramoyl-L-alanine amidase family protein [Radiobacillus deserti]|uniref:N-acetylmuramoyl-L-alanine amidase family protein n=1 Tax=Radiobacillus deserti TaxID=2594883 RepID=UPI0013157177|nr:N-acetylmuramoyl-L-alanine amidase [Radiobacillus deserti]